MTQSETPNHVTPYLITQHASEALEFYQKAFSAKEIYRFTNDDGSVIMHGEIEIGSSRVYIADECDGSEPFSENYRSPQTVKATTVILHIYTDDVETLFKQAINAGAECIMPLTDMFWGDRYGQIKDPFGHIWSLATQKKHMTSEEIIEAGRKAMNPDQE